MSQSRTYYVQMYYTHTRSMFIGNNLSSKASSWTEYKSCVKIEYQKQLITVKRPQRACHLHSHPVKILHLQSHKMQNGWISETNWVTLNSWRKVEVHDRSPDIYDHSGSLYESGLYTTQSRIMNRLKNQSFFFES